MKPQCNSTCQHACGCLCDRTPGAAVPAGYVIDSSNADKFEAINCRVYSDGKCVTVGEAWQPPHDGRVSQIQCDRGPLDAWHDAQEQEAEDAAWIDDRKRTLVRVGVYVALVAACAGCAYLTIFP